MIMGTALVIFCVSIDVTKWSSSFFVCPLLV